MKYFYGILCIVGTVLWLPILGTAAVGVSLGLPLFSLMREQQLAQVEQPNPQAEA